MCPTFGWSVGGAHTKTLKRRMFGAVKRTRTSTPVKGLAPQASASTSSAMTADASRLAARSEAVV
jgi:hypothetical protein